MSIAVERETSYPQQLVQIMREHSLIVPGEEDQMVDYLFLTQ
jgi:hypothetical protein